MEREEKHPLQDGTQRRGWGVPVAVTTRPLTRADVVAAQSRGAARATPTVARLELELLREMAGSGMEEDPRTSELRETPINFSGWQGSSERQGAHARMQEPRQAMGCARRGITCDGLGKAIAEVWSALHRSRENWGCQGEHTSFWHDNQIGYERVNKGLFCLTFLI